MINGAQESSDGIAEQSNAKRLPPPSIAEFLFYCRTGNLEGVELGIQSLPLDDILVDTSYRHVALVNSAEHGQLEVVNRFLKIEKFVLIASARNNIALRMALKRNHLLVASRLLEIEIVRKEAIRQAAKSGDLEMVKKLLPFYALKNDLVEIRTALYIAAKAGHLDIVTCLLKIDSVRNNENALLKALDLASKLGRLKIVNYLLAFDVVRNNAKAILEAFGDAAHRGRLAVVDCFLEIEFVRNNANVLSEALYSTVCELPSDGKHAVMIRLLELEIVRNDTKTLIKALSYASTWRRLEAVTLLLKLVVRNNKGPFSPVLLEMVKTYAKSRVVAAVALTKPELSLPKDLVTKILSYAFHDVMCGNRKCFESPEDMLTKNATSSCPIITQFTSDAINCKKREKERIQKEKDQEELRIQLEKCSLGPDAC